MNAEIMDYRAAYEELKQRVGSFQISRILSRAGWRFQHDADYERWINDRTGTVQPPADAPMVVFWADLSEDDIVHLPQTDFNSRGTLLIRYKELAAYRDSGLLKEQPAGYANPYAVHEFRLSPGGARYTFPIIYDTDAWYLHSILIKRSRPDRLGNIRHAIGFRFKLRRSYVVPRPPDDTTPVYDPFDPNFAEFDSSAGSGEPESRFDDRDLGNDFQQRVDQEPGWVQEDRGNLSSPLLENNTLLQSQTRDISSVRSSQNLRQSPAPERERASDNSSVARDLITEYFLLLDAVPVLERGRFFPCGEDKRPLVVDGVRWRWSEKSFEATDQELIDLIRAYPTLRLGWIPPEGVIVIDIDTGDQFFTVDEFFQLFGDRFTLFRTPRGWHLLCELPSTDVISLLGAFGGGGVKVQTVLGPIDFRGPGNYIVLPFNDPSRAVCHSNWLLPQEKFVFFPVGNGFAGTKKFPIHEGERNETLFKLACSMREAKRVRYTERGIRYALSRINAVLVRPPLPQAELEQIISSAMRYGNGSVVSPGGSTDFNVREAQPYMDSEESFANFSYREAIMSRIEPLDLFALPGEITLIKGIPKAGKSSFVRALAGHAVERGIRIGWLAMEEGKLLFKIHTLVDPRLASAWQHGNLVVKIPQRPVVTLQEMIRAVESLARDDKVQMVIVDTLVYGMSDIEFKNYLQVVTALQQIRRIAQRYGIHIFLLHHTNKSDAELGNSSLGSTGFDAVPDNLIQIGWNGKVNITSRVFGRLETQLPYDSERRRYDIAPIVAYANAVLEGLPVETEEEPENEPSDNQSGNPIREYVDGRDYPSEPPIQEPNQNEYPLVEQPVEQPVGELPVGDRSDTQVQRPAEDNAIVENDQDYDPLFDDPDFDLSILFEDSDLEEEPAPDSVPAQDEPVSDTAESTLCENSASNVAPALRDSGGLLPSSPCSTSTNNLRTPNKHPTANHRAIGGRVGQPGPPATFSEPVGVDGQQKDWERSVHDLLPSCSPFNQPRAAQTEHGGGGIISSSGSYPVSQEGGCEERSPPRQSCLA